jgi:glycosyltransferase involved in cell wall biosynthesis
MNPIRITHILPGLGVGGAERMLVHLVTGMDRQRFENRVISLTDEGVLGARLRRQGIDVQTLGLARVPDPVRLARLAGWLRHSRPDLVQTWLYAADLLGGVAARLAGNHNVVWNLRQRAPAPSDPRRHRWTARACATLSSTVPRAILSCSEDARRSHERFGYRPGTVVIPNGFELPPQRASPSDRAAVRSELHLDDRTPLVAMVARFDPVKGHHDLLAAMTRVSVGVPDVHVVLCGEGMAASNTRLTAWIRHHRLEGRIHLLGRRDDVPRVLAAVDVAVSASLSEGFPNAVGEAMVSAIPCVVTDAGDTVALVGDTAVVVPPGEPRALAEAIEKVLTLSDERRAEMGRRARQRVERCFALPEIVDRYAEFYTSLAQPALGRRSVCRS